VLSDDSSRRAGASPRPRPPSDPEGTVDAPLEPADDLSAQAARSISQDLQIASLGASGLVLFALIKAYAAANFSLTTASALLTTAPLNVLLGTLVSYSYQIIPLLALAALCWAVGTWRLHPWHPLSLLAFGLSVLFLLLSPWRNFWPMAVAFAVVLGLYAVAARLLRGSGATSALGASRRWLPPLPGLVWAFFVGATLWVVLRSLTNLWVPVEVVTVAPETGRVMVVGHVLTADSDWTTIIRAQDKGISRFRSETIEARQLCHLTGTQPGGRGPILWFFARRDYVSANINCARMVAQRPHIPVLSGSLPKQ
jgi:hypothetical protein